MPRPRSLLHGAVEVGIKPAHLLDTSEGNARAAAGRTRSERPLDGREASGRPRE